VAVFINAPERFAGVFPEHAAEASARRIDEDQVAGVKQAVLVLNELIRRSLLMFSVRRDDAAWAKGPHVQIHRRASRAAVIEEGDGPASGGRALLKVGHVEDTGRGELIFGFGREIDAGVGKVFPVETDHGVLYVSGANGECPGNGTVGDGLATYRHGAFGRGISRRCGRERFGFDVVFSVVLVLCRGAGRDCHRHKHCDEQKSSRTHAIFH
jgi:hypothetical protein